MKPIEIVSWKDVKITNVDSLPKGLGAKFLECMKAHREDLPLIAIKWRRKLPDSMPRGHVIVDYSSI